MAEQKEYCVDGYHFMSVEDAREAQVETVKAEYFGSKLQGKNAESMLAVYDKVLDEKMFETPIGWEYLKSCKESFAAMEFRKDRSALFHCMLPFAIRTAG